MNVERGQADRPAAGMELLIEFSSDSVDVLRAAPLTYAPQIQLQAPGLDEGHLPRLTTGLSEVVLTMMSIPAGTPKEFGFPIPGRRYVDFGDPEAGTLQGGPRPIPPGERDIRAVRIPWPEGTAFLFLHRTDAFMGFTGLELQRKSLLLIPVGPHRDERPDTLPHGLPMPRVAPLLLAQPWPGRPRSLPWLSPDSMGLDGCYVSKESDAGNGDSAQRYDIVITGDGFTSGDLVRFDALADRLKRGLAGMEPFLSMGALINWHVVRVASTDSGINRCPDAEPSVPPKRTFYGVEGCWDNTGVPGFLGTRHPERIQWAAENVAPWEQVELVIVIANCSVWGGHAWPGWKAAIVTAYGPRFVELAAHECGHVIAQLAEEYIVCVKDNPLWPDPNKARLPEVGRSVMRKVGGPTNPLPWPVDTIWWHGLPPKPGERNSDGTFAAVLTGLDPIVTTDGISPDEQPGQAGFVGAFWGCQDTIGFAELERFLRTAATVQGIDVAPLEALLLSLAGSDRQPIVRAEIGCDFFWDLRGAFYFRPSAHCRMRHPVYRFCRVCRHLIANRIREASGRLPHPPLP